MRKHGVISYKCNYRPVRTAIPSDPTVNHPQENTMKFPTLRTASVTALFSILGAALILPSTFAQDLPDRPAMQGGGMRGPGMGGPRGGRGGPRQADPENMIEHLDTNADSKVSLEEF